MARLSVNLNKIALLRNSRGGSSPDVRQFAIAAIDAGVRSLTVHPRVDGRHIRLDDVVALARLPQVEAGTVELNIEGDLRPDLVRLVRSVEPTQFTVVPTSPNELTSMRGWRASDSLDLLKSVVDELHADTGTRVSVFCDPDSSSCTLAMSAGVDAVELYTGVYAEAFAAGKPDDELDRLAQAANVARAASLRLNGGHDLSLENLPLLLNRIRFDEVSIGHQLTVDALERGWRAAVFAYIACVSGGSTK